MTNSEQNQLIADLARDLVVQTAPQELPLFRATSTAYFKSPDKVLKNTKGKEEMLGFGVAEAAVMMTPSILVVMTRVVQFVTAEVEKSVATESTSLISDLIKQMFKKFRSSEAKKEQHTPSPLTPEQLAQVSKLAYKEATRLMHSDARARLLADAIVGSLVTSSSS